MRLAPGMRTQVGIVGAGPAGLFLSHLLAERGIDSVVVDNRSRAYAEARIRAGVLEAGSVEALTAAGLGDRLHREGLSTTASTCSSRASGTTSTSTSSSVAACGCTARPRWSRTCWPRGTPRADRSSGRCPTRRARDRHRPAVRHLHRRRRHAAEVECDVIAGCDGFHGIGRAEHPHRRASRSGTAPTPTAGSGSSPTSPPSTDELIYAWHPERLRAAQHAFPSVSRLYLQVGADEDIADWSDDRIWDALATAWPRGWSLTEGPVRDKSITPMRSYVSTPMRHGNLFLAGDAAHIVPPTGAKGLNLALADVALLPSPGRAARRDDRSLAEAYSETAIQRVWRRRTSRGG